MSENRESYADGIGEITLSGGMVRIDLVTLQGTQKNSESKPKTGNFTTDHHAT